MSHNETHAYAAFCRECNGMFGVTVDSADMRADNAREVAKWMKVADRVERVLITDVRSGALTWCKCGTNRRKRASAAKAEQGALL